ncbi:DUF4355 domain-containing protein [Salimicrobium halophilum]|uniref:DUF4355 domain-containing protein n=1 Tax=Salimicrobium halophilum TaxID=86666 RepID=A0A1G8WFP1_9BACI|nr:DUF4355 domain-containing protein [Salimicrobium halophilum]SDJ76360.1 protein of unknown function [Salimicrobium halophilum]
MKWEEIKAWLEQNLTDEQVKEFINSNADEQEITLDKVQQLVKEDKDAKAWMDREKDKHHNRALETWKANNLDSLIEEEVNKKNPQKSPQEMEIEKMRKQMEAMQNEKNREALRNKALNVANEKQIPTDMVDYFLGEDEDSTVENLNFFQEKLNAIVQDQVKNRMDENSYTPPKDNAGNTITREQIEKMSPEEINENWDQVQTVLENEG